MRRLMSLLSVAAVVLMAALVAWSWADGGIVSDLLSADTDASTKMVRLRQFFDGFGWLAPLVYVGFVTVEVVIAPLPGLMLYAPGGVIFGAVAGGAMSLAGNVLGAGIACGVTRSLGSNWLSRLLPEESLEQVQLKLERRGWWLVLLLRINPLTSSDLVSYAAGFTRIPVWQVMLATMFGMAPLCFAQAWLADNVLAAVPGLLYPLLVLCGIYAVGVVVVLHRLSRTQRSSPPSRMDEPPPSALPDAQSRD